MSPQSLKNYFNWTELPNNTKLGYLKDHRKDMRRDLRQVYPECRSALVFIFSYAPEKKWQDQHFLEMRPASYLFATGETDYHLVLPERMELVLKTLKESYPGLEGKIACDTLPILDRDLAFRAGLGWFGKNSMLIHRKLGSYFLIGSILLNQDLTQKKPLLEIDHCGQCVACIESCPTQAIDGDRRVLKTDQCISTFTIEVFKPEDPPEGFGADSSEVFGCDICQEVCPWNRKPLEAEQSIPRSDLESSVVSEIFLTPRPKLIENLEQMSNRGYRKWVKSTALERTGRVGLLKNLLNLRKNMGSG